MRKNMSHWNYISSKQFVTIPPKSIPFLPGLFLMALGAVLFLAPKFFLAAVSSFLILLGFAFCYVAWKLISLKKQVSRLAEELRNTVEIRAFQVQNDDIDISEIDSKKIFFH